MVSKIINDWLEEGFADLNEAKLENSLIPTFTSNKGLIQTPKPLFTRFFEKTDLEADFLPQYFEALEKKFIRESALNLDWYVSEIEKVKSQEQVLELKFTPIEYDRRDIFLSRVMFNLFEMPDSSVPKGSPQYSSVVERNELYLRALEKREKCPENYKEKSFQTNFIDSAEKQIETIPILIENKKCMIDNYQIKKHYDRSEMKVEPPPKTFKEFCDAKTKFLNYTEFLDNIEIYPEILNRFKEALYITEKTLNYNTFKNSILEYNGCKKNSSDCIDAVPENSEDFAYENNLEHIEYFDIKPHLHFHLQKMDHDYRVTCIECSPINPSIFVVGYGVSHFKEMDYNPRGMVLCWNIHKCGYPEKIYYTEEIVTCLEFSRTEPHFVGVGMRYGLIAIFDLRKSDLFSILNNYSSKVKPLGTIKNVRWVKKAYAMGKEMEVLLSVSMDGVISSWSHGRKLDGQVMRYIKRGSDITEEQRMILAIGVAGMSMQIKPVSAETFLIGTIEGQVLQAEINDPDSYTHVYHCHNGPLYDLQWSPLVSNVFMTCGADRFVRIYQTGKAKPSKSLILEEAVLKVTWSSVKSTLFAAMSAKKILFFDLSINLHKEIAEYYATKNLTFSYLTFCPKNNWFLIGQSDGITGLYELVDIPPLNISQEKALRNAFLLD